MSEDQNQSPAGTTAGLQQQAVQWAEDQVATLAKHDDAAAAGVFDALAAGDRLVVVIVTAGGAPQIDLVLIDAGGRMKPIASARAESAWAAKH
ncbi:hypothetical protein E2F46_06165 [Luteimonas aestuarii]|uniref:Uncharacterized protein n=1 Tax=Luteimonas aestuarii TaxID=453837 RepID=A0A4R5TY75_9GAMM|nr:hypothetical protein [Luteimonas aestuarii]TDK26179.1 hypothetical protein E2F46_06165 [Luteimonas aestuarii]